MGLVTDLPIRWSHEHICCKLSPTSTHMALILGIFVLYIPLSCISSPCNLLFLNLAVQLFSHVPPVTVWGMAHVFDGKLYFTRDHMQGNFIPKNLTLPKPKPAPKPQPKASSSGEHVQLFRMVYDRKKGFRAEHL